MRPAQLRWQKDVSYDERGNILSMTRLDPAHFPSHRLAMIHGIYENARSAMVINDRVLEIIIIEMVIII